MSLFDFLPRLIVTVIVCVNRRDNHSHNHLYDGPCIYRHVKLTNQFFDIKTWLQQKINQEPNLCQTLVENEIVAQVGKTVGEE